MKIEREEVQNWKKLVIVLVVLLIIIGMGIFVYEYYLKNNDASDNQVTGDSSSQINDEIVLTFDESKIVNKNSEFDYALNEEESNSLLGVGDEGYYIIVNYDVEVDGKTGSENIEVPGTYSSAISGFVDEGGPGIDCLYMVFLSSDGDISYINYDNFVNNNDHSIKNISEITDAKKLYLANCTNKDQSGEFSDDRDTILVQTSDGSIYDLYDYLSDDEEDNSLIFDDSKIVNKVDGYNYTYVLCSDDECDNNFDNYFSNNSDGFYLINTYTDDNTNIKDSIKVDVDFKSFIFGSVYGYFTMGLNLNVFYTVFLSNNGDLSFINYCNYVSNNSESKNYCESYNSNDKDINEISNIKNVKKIYYAKYEQLDKDFYPADEVGEYGISGYTILAQLADGSIYDLYDYLKEVEN